MISALKWWYTDPIEWLTLHGPPAELFDVREIKTVLFLSPSVCLFRLYSLSLELSLLLSLHLSSLFLTLFLSRSWNHLDFLDMVNKYKKEIKDCVINSLIKENSLLLNALVFAPCNTLYKHISAFESIASLVFCMLCTYICIYRCFIGFINTSCDDHQPESCVHGQEKYSVA